MPYVLYDPPTRIDLYPLTLTRPVADLRLGIDRVQDKWMRSLGEPVPLLAYGALAHRSTCLPAPADATYIAGHLLPDADLCAAIQQLGPDEGLQDPAGMPLAFRAGAAPTADGLLPPRVRLTTYPHTFGSLAAPWDLFRLNGDWIRKDYAALTAGRACPPVADPHTAVYGQVFVAAGAQVRAAILDGTDGPIYIAPGAQVQPGAIIQGAHALCEGAVVNAGAKLRGDSTLGPYCKVGGEVSNSVLWGYSNKGHDGFLGNSVLGAWCNLGADTNTSNLKNNYSPVRAYSYRQQAMVETGLQFCGLIMGDHSKSSINTMFNTGTTVGVSASIFGADFPPKYIPSFRWGGAGGWVPYEVEKALATARAVMARRDQHLEPAEEALLRWIAATAGL
ncbi:MAG: GlmU family protein [Bacteroidetes bacterium]|jgi:UDP-N-acetylglucosamine diphosphorylase/glucosamine-1-phosphate N-acetyltransferase|nr:GlmU family protein [Bacteroidota bacterium]